MELLCLVYLILFFAEVVSGIESFATSSGYSLLLTYTKDDPICEKECMNELLMRNVSGIINISPNTERVDSSFFDQMASRIPLVFINSYIKRPAISYVYNDERIGTKNCLRTFSIIRSSKYLFRSR